MKRAQAARGGLLVLASLLLAGAGAVHGQALGTLRITAIVMDAGQRPTPAAGHVLLVSDEPPTAPPRAIVLGRDGTASVRLRPGNYTVESDKPVAFQGRVLQWTKHVDIVAGGDVVLELTGDNVDVGALVAETPVAAAPLETDPSFLLPQWQASVVALWTPTHHASGFLVDARGLIATNARGIDTATAVEVQLSPEIKVPAHVLVADPARDVALLRIDPTVVASVRPVPLGCTQADGPSIVEGQEILAIGTPLREPTALTSGTVDRVDPRLLAADMRLPPGSAGGPVFMTDGRVVGITSIAADGDERSRDATRVVRIDAACGAMTSAETQMQREPPPSGTRLPVEPTRPFPQAALDEAARRAGGLSPPQMSSSDFDITFITPMLLHGAQAQAEARGNRLGGPGGAGTESDPLRMLREFSNWSEYVADVPPVLLIRVRPRLVERFWTTVARGAARTQGVALPPIKRFKAGFSRMRLSCGGATVTPIHPFTLEQRTSETEAIREGLYVYDPGALGPHCGTAELVLYSEQDPEKGDTRRVDPATIARLWQEFAPYRALADAPTARAEAPPR